MDCEITKIRQIQLEFKQMLECGNEDFVQGILAFSALRIAPAKIVSVIEGDDILPSRWKRLIINHVKKGNMPSLLPQM